ncbi:ankyrin repeat domain-containing protein 17-like [Styela clava]
MSEAPADEKRVTPPQVTKQEMTREEQFNTAASVLTSKLAQIAGQTLGAEASELQDFENISGDECLPVDLETQARLEALLEAAGIGKLSTSDGKAFADPDVLHRLTSTVSYALDEAAAALSRLRIEAAGQDIQRTLPEACSDGDVATVRRLLEEGRSVHETTEDGESLLSLACSAGYYELTEVLLSMHANIEERGPKGGCTPLMEAASGGYKDIVELLIAHGADLDATSSTGNTALTFACCGGYDEIVEILISAGADLEVQNENGHTPLMEAASGGHVNVAAILLQHGAGINTHSNEFKESALTLACYKGHLEMVKFLLQAGADQEHKTDEMHTALMEASMDGHVDVAKLLLDSGAQVNMPADSFESPLTLAACGGHVELASLLLLRGANLEEVNDEGYTPLMEASREGHEKMVIVLLAHGANVNVLTEETQETALTLAACGGFLECCKLLICAGANLEDGCSTPLMEAAQEGHLELVKYLLEQGANVDSQTSSGNTALSYACEHGRTNVADVLLHAGACLEHESEGGRTPLMKAARAGHLCTVQYLISRGANVNKRTRNNDHTVLSLACVYGHLSVVELLLCQGADPTHKLKDGSTMLLEAAKGGHTSVVQLLLDFPEIYMKTTSRHQASIQANNSPSPEQPVPRVPTQTLPIIVPPQEPDTAPIENDFTLKLSTPGKTSKVAEPEPNVIEATVELRDMKKICRHYQQSIQNEKNLAEPLQSRVSNSQPSELEQDAASLLKSTAVTSETADLSSDTKLTQLEQRIKQAIEINAKMKCLEASQNSLGSKIQAMCADEDLQLLKKQRILEELQKVELNLQEKATRQFKVNSNFHSLPDTAHQCDISRGNPDGGDGISGYNFQKEEEQCSTSDEDENLQLDDSASPSPALQDMESMESKHYSTPQDTTDEFAATDEETVVTPTPFVPENSLLKPDDRAIRIEMDIDCYTESNNDTPLTLACAGGHRELVQLLISRGANLEHRDKKGFSPLILAATAGHVGVVSTLLDANADIESQCIRTKDTPLSLACSGGRLEVVELLLERGANIEHRNVSDYTPLSLAASGGYVRIIELLLNAGAEINSRTGSKLGISPLMLAAMNGHTDAVLLLLDMGADINAQIETNRNTALTLACFQGRHEVVSLLVDRRANVEHRAKTGLTPLMEAASGGYAEVGRVLLQKGADVNAAPVPSSRDTALTIAADKGHVRFCELVLSRWAFVDVRNKKGNTPFWLACNGGHLDVAKLLGRNGADLNTADNRNITPLMAAFRKGHIKVVRWVSKLVSQFPSDTECMRYIATVSDAELEKRCHTCMDCIVSAKERQAQEANKYASELLDEIDKEKSREENRKERAARKREKRRKKRKEKQQSTKQEREDCENEESEEANDIPVRSPTCEPPPPSTVVPEASKILTTTTASSNNDTSTQSSSTTSESKKSSNKQKQTLQKEPSPPRIPACHATADVRVKPASRPSKQPPLSTTSVLNQQLQQTPGRSKNKKDEEWKEVVRKSKKITVPSNLISRVIGRGGCNIKAIREVTGAHIDINKQRKGLERTITIRGPVESIRHAHELINELTKDKNSDCDIQVIIASIQKKFASSAPKTNSVSTHPTQPSAVEATTLTTPRAAPPANVTPVKNAPKTVPPTQRRPIGRPKEIPTSMSSSTVQNDTEKNITEKLPKNVAPAPIPGVFSSVPIKSMDNTAAPTLPIPPTSVSPAASPPMSTVPSVVASHMSTAPLPFMARTAGKPVNRPVQPVAPMISLKSSPYKTQQLAAPGSHITTFTTAGYSPTDTSTWQPSAMRSPAIADHPRPIQQMRPFDPTRQNQIQPSNLYSYNDRLSENVNSNFMSQQPTSGYSTNNQQQQMKTSVWDQDIQSESIAAGNQQQQLTANNLQNNNTTPDVQQERKIWPIGTERAFNHRRSAVLHPEQQQQHISNNNASLWTMPRPMHDPDSYSNWTGSGTQNPLWQNAINNNASLSGRVPPLPPKPLDGQFVNSDMMMNADPQNITSASIRPEKRDSMELTNTMPGLYQQQAANMNNLMMTNVSGVGTQPPIGSHLGNSAIDSANRSVTVAPQPVNPLQVGAFKNHFGGGLPDQMHSFVGMSAGGQGYHFGANERKNLFAAASDENKRLPSMIPEQFSRFPQQMQFTDRLQEMENMAFNPQMMMSPNMRMGNVMQKDMSMFQRNVGIRQPNVSSSQQKSNDSDPAMLFSGSSGAVNYMAAKDNSSWNW